MKQKNASLLRNPVYFLVVALLVAGCNQDNNVSNEVELVEAYLDSADGYIEQGRFRSALIELSNALSINSADARVRRQLARIDLNLGNYQDALDALGQLNQELPGDAETLMSLGEVLIAMGDADGALQLLNGVQMQRVEQQDRLNVLLGQSWVSRGEARTARTLYQSVVNGNPDNLDALISLSMLEFKEGNLDLSQDYMEQAIAVEPNSLDLWIWRGVYATFNEDYPEAERAFSEALATTDTYDEMTAKKYSVLQSILVPLHMQQKTEEVMRYSQMIAETPQGQFQGSIRSAIELFPSSQYGQVERALQTELRTSFADLTSNILTGTQNVNGEFSRAIESLESFATSAGPDSQSVKTFAATLIQLGQLERASSILLEAAGNFPDDGTVMAMLGVCQQLQGRVQESIDSFNQAIELMPDSPEALYRLALSHSQAEEFEETETYLKQVTSLAPEFSPAKTALIGLYIQQNDTTSALEQSQLWLDENPNSATNNYIAGNVALLNGEGQRAVDLFATVLSLDVTNIPARLSLTNIALAQQDLFQAEEFINQILAIDPLNVNAIAGKLATGLQLDLLESRVGEIQQIIDNNPTEYIPSLVVAQFLLMAVGDIPRALDFSEQAFTRVNNAQTENVYVNLLARQASALAQSANFAESSEVLERARSISPDSPDILEAEGDLYFAQRDFETAVDLYIQNWNVRKSDNAGIKLYQSLQASEQSEQAIQLLNSWKESDPENGMVNMLFGMHHLSNGEESQAIESFELALESGSGNVVLLNNLAWLYQDRSPARALELSSLAVELAPESPEVLDTHGWILYKNGNQEEAATFLEQALELAPDSASIAEHLREVQR